MLQRRRVAKIIGFVDGIHGSTIRGWAADSNAFDDVLEVMVVAEGRTIGKGRADQFRSDLLAAGYGQGLHGFEVSLAEMPSFSASFEVVAFRPNASHSKTTIRPSSTYAQIWRTYFSQLQTVEPSTDIQETCRQVRKGCLGVSDRTLTDAEHVFFSDELFMKTILACAAKS